MTRSKPRRAGNWGDNPPKIPSVPSSCLERLLSSFLGCQYPQITFLCLIPGLLFPGAVVALWDTQEVSSPSPPVLSLPGRERGWIFVPWTLLSPQLISRAHNSWPCWGQILSLASKEKTTGKKREKNSQSFPLFPAPPQCPCTSSPSLFVCFMGFFLVFFFFPSCNFQL